MHNELEHNWSAAPRKQRRAWRPCREGPGHFLALGPGRAAVETAFNQNKVAKPC